MGSPRARPLAVVAGALVGLQACSGPQQVTPPGDAAVLDVSVADVTGARDAGVPDAPATALSDASVEATADAPPGAIVCPTDGGVPGDLSCTGLYGDWASRTLAPGVMPFTPGLVFWSDGAQKSRWIFLPPGTAIDTTDMDSWVFPVGTKIWKEFQLGGHTIETRLIWKTAASQWTFLDYRWSADGASAPELDNGETNVDGTTYEIPATWVCPDCHAGRQDSVLGFDFIGLGVAGSRGVTLASLVDAGLLTRPPPALSVTIPEDATRKAAAALGWLHVNCGEACHNSNINAMASVTGLRMKLLAGALYPADGGAARVSDLDTYTSAVDVAATLAPYGLPWMRIAPGDSSHSLLPQMASARQPDAGEYQQMPPIVSHAPDVSGVTLVKAWIDALGDGGSPGAEAGPDGGGD
jgi:hypothetical protein